MIKEVELVDNDAVIESWVVDEDGNIHFTLVSNGYNPEQWIHHFETNGYNVSDHTRNILRRAVEASTNGRAYHIVVTPGRKICNSDRVTNNIRSTAEKKGWVKPHWEVAPLIRITFTDQQLDRMGFGGIVVMHEPIIDAGNCPNVLTSNRMTGSHSLISSDGGPNSRWFEFCGFAFDESRVGHQN